VYSAVVLPLEDGRMLVTLSGLRGCEPPTDPDGFTRFAKRLPHPFVHDWLTRAEPVSAPYGFRNTANIRRRYDLPGRRPAGFLAIGDALCTFNPIYGQGMAVAALNALALRDALAADAPGGSALSGRRRWPGARQVRPGTREVQRALLRSARDAWDISAGADRTMPGAAGSAAGLGAADRPANWYLARVQRRAAGDPLVGTAFRSVLSLQSPPAALFAPRVLRALLFGPEPATPAGPVWRRGDEGDGGGTGGGIGGSGVSGGPA
jgi:flavin-dependent dehydrogenase